MRSSGPGCEGRVPLASSGPRLSVAAALAAVGTRLVWSARIVEEPSAGWSTSSPCPRAWDPGLLPLIPSRGAGAGAEGVDVLDRATTPPIEGRVVALAFIGDERLLVLFDDALALYRRDGLALRLESRRDLPGPLAGVRFPGGLLLAAESESACWALTSRTPRAVLFSLDGSRLTSSAASGRAALAARRGGRALPPGNEPARRGGPRPRPGRSSRWSRTRAGWWPRTAPCRAWARRIRRPAPPRGAGPRAACGRG